MAPDIRGLVFDLDGTLVDHRGSVAAALRGWLPQLGLVFDEDLLTYWLAAEQRHFPARRSRQITFAEQRRRRLRDFLPLIGHPVEDDAQLDAGSGFQGKVGCAQWALASRPDLVVARFERFDDGSALSDPLSTCLPESHQ